MIDNNIVFSSGTMNANTTGMYVTYAGADGPNYFIYSNTFVGLNDGFTTQNLTAATTVVYKNNLFSSCGIHVTPFFSSFFVH